MPETTARAGDEPDDDSSLSTLRAESSGGCAAWLASVARSTDRLTAERSVSAMTSECVSVTGRGLDLTGADLRGLDLSGFDLRWATLNRTALFGTNLSAAILTGASLVCAGLERTDFTAAVLHGAYVHALAAQASVFVDADLTGLIDGTGALFHGCDMSGVTLDRAELAGVTFYQCGLSGAHAQGTDLRGSAFNECRMDRMDFTLAVVDECTITRSSMRGVVLNRARGQGLVIQRPSSADGLQLSAARLPNLRLSSVRGRGIVATELSASDIDVLDSQMIGADLRDADLAGGRWARTSVDHGNLSGAVLANSWWQQVTLVEATLADAAGEGMTATECSFTRAHFTGFAGRYATFRNCDLQAADLQRAYLYRCSFVGDPPTSACLASTNFDGANLTQAYLAADFTGASLRHVIATYARVNQSIFAGADLTGLNMFRASAVKTDFTDARLTGTLGYVFTDRRPGLSASLSNSDDSESGRVAEFITDLEKLLDSDTRKST